MATTLLTSQGAMLRLPPVYNSPSSSANAMASFPLVPWLDFLLICIWCTSSKKYLTKGSVFAKHWSTLFIKHVFPRFCRPQSPFAWPDLNPSFFMSWAISFFSSSSFYSSFLLIFWNYLFLFYFFILDAFSTIGIIVHGHLAPFSCCNLTSNIRISLSATSISSIVEVKLKILPFTSIGSSSNLPSVS